jgi:Tfp pilus assembly protein PilP
MNFTCKIPDFSDRKINQYLILFILSIALCWFYYQWYLKDQIDYLRTVQDQISSLHHRIKLESAVSSKPGNLNNMTRYNQSQIPNYLSHAGDTQAGLLLILNQLIKNLRLEKLVWLPETHGDYVKIPLKLTLSGRNPQIIHVLQSIAQLEDAIEVSWFKIETLEHRQQLSLAINFFRQTRKTHTKKTFPSEKSVAKNRVPIKIKDYPLFSLKMLGYLQHRGKKLGLIATPDGLVHSIGIGQYIGAERAKVVSIDQNKIRVFSLETKKIIEINGSNNAIAND